MLKSRMHHKSCLAAVALALGASHLLGAGFALYETSTRSIATGGAVVGSPRGASTIYDNAAGMTALPGSNIEVGISGIGPRMDIDVTTPQGKSRYSPSDQWFPPPFAYYSQQIDDSWWAGIGLYSPYGLGVRHKSDWPGQNNSVKSKITSFDVNPNVAYKFSDRLSVAAGLQVMYFDIELTRAIPGVPATLKIDGDSVGYGGNAAIQYRVLDDLTLGLIYRSPVKQSVDGDATLGGNSVGAKGRITLPASYTVGLNYTGVERWNFGAIATFTEWSDYDKLKMRFASPALLGVSESVSRKDWHNAWRLGLGAEYQACERMMLQAGYVYDVDPIRTAQADYLLPPGDRHIVSLGADYDLGGDWKVGASMAYLMLRDVTVKARPEEHVLGTKFTNGDTLIFSLSLAKSF